ncbi:MAG: exosome complex RNA-binding protein Rrp4, partial [Candidatus Bathyarchaeia archaeon]
LRMAPLLIGRREIVVPGDLLAEGDLRPGDNVLREGDRIYALKVGLVDLEGERVSVVPLKGCYFPRPGDLVIGRIVEAGLTGWEVDILAPYPALLPMSETYTKGQASKTDLSTIFSTGDLVMAKVIAFDRTRDPLLTAKGPGLGKAFGNRVVRISPMKIPRLIGRKGSMITMLKRETGCRIIVGQNGVVLISGRDDRAERAVVEAIYKIEREAHTQGLTDEIKEMVRKELGG